MEQCPDRYLVETVPAEQACQTHSAWVGRKHEVSARSRPYVHRYRTHEAISSFGCVLLPDEPEVMAEGFNPEFLEDRVGKGGGTIYGPDGRRQLRLWGLTLGMTL